MIVGQAAGWMSSVHPTAPFLLVALLNTSLVLFVNVSTLG